MQREQLYNLQSKACFNHVAFVFKISRVLCHQFLMLRQVIVQNLDFLKTKNAQLQQALL